MSRPSLLLYITFVNTFSSVKNVFSVNKKVTVWKVIFSQYYRDNPQLVFFSNFPVGLLLDRDFIALRMSSFEKKVNENEFC